MSRINTTIVYKSILRFMMTIPVITPFFVGGFHQWTDVCVNTDPKDIDKYLAIGSTIVAYFLIYPCIYTLAMV